MGFFDFISEIGSCIIEKGKELIRSVAKIGSVLVAVAEPVIHVVTAIAPQIGITLKAGLNIVKSVVYAASVAAGFINEDESVEDIGERSLEAADQGITREDYDTPDDYLSAIRDVPLNSDRNKYTDEQRITAGIGVLGDVLNCHLGINPEFYGIMMRYRQFFTDSRIKSFIQYAEEAHIDILVLQDYFNSNTTYEDFQNARQLIHDVERANNPAYDEALLDEQLIALKENRQGQK